MSLSDDIKKHATETFEETWSTREGSVVPDPSDLKLSNDAVKFERATILYADLDASTSLVDSKKWWFAGEVYKTFLYAASRIIRNSGGQIVSYDGDRVMGIFISKRQCNAAASCGLKINYAVKRVIQPALNAKYPSSVFQISHVVGIDTSEIHAARTGVRGDNDIVWIGRAANYAAKLTTLSSSYPTWITGRAYAYLDDDQKFGGNPRAHMWEKRVWTPMNNLEIYRSNWRRSL